MRLAPAISNASGTDEDPTIDKLSIMTLSLRLGPIPQGDWTFIYQAMGYVADGVTNEYPWIGMRIAEWNEDGNQVWNWDPFEQFRHQ